MRLKSKIVRQSGRVNRGTLLVYHGYFTGKIPHRPRMKRAEQRSGIGR